MRQTETKKFKNMKNKIKDMEKRVKRSIMTLIGAAKQKTEIMEEGKCLKTNGSRIYGRLILKFQRPMNSEQVKLKDMHYWEHLY